MISLEEAFKILRRRTLRDQLLFAVHECRDFYIPFSIFRDSGMPAIRVCTWAGGIRKDNGKWDTVMPPGTTCTPKGFRYTTPEGKVRYIRPGGYNPAAEGVRHTVPWGEEIKREYRARLEAHYMKEYGRRYLFPDEQPDWNRDRRRERR